jgi:hypothetical protein
MIVLSGAAPSGPCVVRRNGLVSQGLGLYLDASSSHDIFGADTGWDWALDEESNCTSRGMSLASKLL